jgi:hypothetical protein
LPQPQLGGLGLPTLALVVPAISSRTFGCSGRRSRGRIACAQFRFWVSTTARRAKFNGLFGSISAVPIQHHHHGGQDHPDVASITPSAATPSATMPSANDTLTQQIDAIFQAFDAALLSLEGKLTATDPQLSGFFVLLNGNLNALLEDTWEHRVCNPATEAGLPTPKLFVIYSPYRNHALG